MNNKPIAFFDSGVGGLTVFEQVKKILPNEDYIYLGDLKNSPYGEKSKSELLKIADEIFKYFDKLGVKAVVMACNTTSANVYEELKDNYSFKIYPIIQSCAKMISQMQINKVGVFATKATVSSRAYSKELSKYNTNLEVFEMACPKWVEIVERKLQSEDESQKNILENLSLMLEKKPDKVILGCTHYPYLITELSQFAPEKLFIDPSKCFAKFIKDDLQELLMLNDSQTSGSAKFYVTAKPKMFRQAASLFSRLEELPEVIII